MFYWTMVWEIWIGEVYRSLHPRTGSRSGFVYCTRHNNISCKVIHGLAQRYFGSFTRVADLPSRRSLRSVDTNRLVVRCLSADCRLLVAEHFRSPARRHGMTSRKTWHQQNHWPHFVASLRHTCSGSLFLTTCWTSTDSLRWTYTIAVVPLLRPPKIVCIMAWNYMHKISPSRCLDSITQTHSFRDFVDDVDRRKSSDVYRRL